MFVFRVCGLGFRGGLGVQDGGADRICGLGLGLTTLGSQRVIRSFKRHTSNTKTQPRHPMRPAPKSGKPSSLSPLLIEPETPKPLKPTPLNP